MAASALSLKAYPNKREFSSIMSVSIKKENGSTDRLELRAELTWDIPKDTSCPLATQLDENPKDVTIHHYNDTCFMEVELLDSSNGTDPHRLKLQETVGNCACPTFWKNGCHPRFQIVEDMSANAEVFLPNRQTLRELIADLRQTDRNPRIRNLTFTGDENDVAEIRSMNVRTLTEREMESIEFAVREGYYDRDRKISLQDIADEFDVNKSTCSERLDSAESKIVKQLFVE